MGKSPRAPAPAIMSTAMSAPARSIHGARAKAALSSPQALKTMRRARVTSIPRRASQTARAPAPRQPISVAMNQAERGTHVDPDLVDVFLEQAETFHRIKIFNEFEDNPESISDLLDHRKAKEKPQAGG